MGCKGVNVTIPHKQAIIKYLDRLTRDAEWIGAVNTIEFKGNRLIGHNTDGKGFIHAFESDCGDTVRGKRVVLLGAGGAARAVAVQLLIQGVSHLTVANRTPGKGHHLVRGLHQLFPRKEIASVSLRGEPLSQGITGADVLINATSSGMKPTDKSPVPQSLLSSRLTVVDLIYNPPETALLREAGLAGARTYNGVGMLVHQGVLAFEIWTGLRPDLGVMKRALTAEFSRQAD